MMDRLAVGRLGENEAARFLEKKGYKVLERNYRCKYGEIDIIARDGRTVAFVEVKTRGTDRFGTALSSVDSRKQKKIMLAAHFYVDSKNLDGADLRFDVVGIEVRGGTLSFELVQDAFEAEEV